MGKSSQYNHYMQRIDIRGQSEINIEDAFPGLFYMKATGMNDIGKPKNVYTEHYADSDRIRVYLPKRNINGRQVADTDAITNEPTKIEMTFLIIGDVSSRQETLRLFSDYVRTGILRYRDDARNRQFEFVVTEEIKVSDERWHGSQPYVEITIPMQNINGKTRVYQPQMTSS